MKAASGIRALHILVSLILCICTALGCVSCASAPASTEGVTDPPPQDSAQVSDSSSGQGTEEPEEKSYIEQLTPSNGKRLRIAFIGDSITQGTGSSNQSLMSYPMQFSRMVSLDYMVGNFGKAAAYVLPYESPYNKRDKRELSYKNTTQYADSIAFKPDIVVITLGVNDIASMFSDKAKQAVKESLIALGRDYEALDSVQKVYIATSIRIHSSARAETFSLGEIQKIQKAAAEEGGFGFLDISAMTYDYLDIMMHHTSDRLHPTDALYKEMARAYKAALFEEEFTPAEVEKSETGVVYVKAGGLDTGKGESPETAVGKLAYAAGLLREGGGKIVLCGNVPTAYQLHMPKTSGNITITSNHGGKDHAGVLTLSYDLYLNGDYTLEHVGVSSSASDPIIYVNFNDLTIGEGVVCTASGYPVIYAGRNSVSGISAEYVSHTGTSAVTVRSGTWAAVIGGNNRTNSGCVIGNIEQGASVSVIIEGGRFVSRGNYATSAVGMNSVTGKCTLTVTGGEFSSGVYALCRGAYTSPARPEIRGEVSLSLSGCTMGGSITAKQDGIPQVSGKVSLTVSEALSGKVVGFTDYTIQ